MKGHDQFDGELTADRAAATDSKVSQGSHAGRPETMTSTAAPRRDGVRAPSRALGDSPLGEAYRGEVPPPRQTLARIFAALLATNEAILRAASPEDLYQGVCDAIVFGGKFAAATVLLAQPGSAWAGVAAMTGAKAEDLRGRIAIDESMPEGRGLVGAAFRTGMPQASNDVVNDERTRPWQTLAREKGVAAGVALPLVDMGNTRGVLVLYAVEKGVFDRELIGWLQRLAANVVHALGNFDREAARQHAEQALRQSETRFRTLVECSSDWYWEQDAELRLIRIEGLNASAGSHSESALRGKRPWEYPGIVVGAEDLERLREALQAREPFRDLVYAFRDERGHLRYVNMTGEPLTGEDGGFAGYRGTARDVTQRKRAQALVTLEHAVTRRLAEAETSRKALQAVMRIICESEHWETGGYFRIEDEAGTSRLVVGWTGPSARQMAVDYYKDTIDRVIPPGGLISRVVSTGSPLWLADMRESQTT